MLCGHRRRTVLGRWSFFFDLIVPCAPETQALKMIGKWEDLAPHRADGEDESRDGF